MPQLPTYEEWEGHAIHELEKESRGVSTPEHPLETYAGTVKKYASVNTLTIQDVANERMIRIGGTLKVLKVHKTKKGDMMAFCAIEDQFQSIEVVVFPNLYAKTHTLLSQEQVVILEAEVQKTENAVKLLGEKIVPIGQAENEWTSGILIQVDAISHGVDVLEQIKPVIERYPGDCISFFKIKIDEEQPPVLVKLGDEYRADAHPTYFQEVETILGQGAIETKCAPVKEKVKKKRWKKKSPA